MKVSVFVALLLCQFSIASADDAIKRQILKLFPQADTDKDGVLSDAEEAVVNNQALKRHPQADTDGDGVLSDAEKRLLLKMAANRLKNKAGNKPAAKAKAGKWNTPGFQRSNTLGGGKAIVPTNGKFRVFVLMGQSNMVGAGTASELKAPYSQKHDRIRIWANGRWEYLVPNQRFGPEVALSHELAKLWPKDTIGIIKVAVGGTGIRGFEKDWSLAQANRTADGKKGPLYKDMLNALAEAKNITNAEFCGFVWKQGGADGKKADLAKEYYGVFKQLISDVRSDIGEPKLPVFVLTYLAEKELAQLEKSQNSRYRHMKPVLMAHNQAARELDDVTAVHHGRLPCNPDGIHFNTEGQLKLGQMTAAAVAKAYELQGK